MNGNNKVFCIGMFKTGTKSFGAAMSILGYTGIYKPWFILRDSKGKADNWYIEPKAWSRYFAEIKERASSYDAFSDAPWMFVYEQCNKWFPNSKFILTLRKDAETLAKSDIRQWRGKPNTPPIKKFIDRYTNHNYRIRQYFRNKDNLLEMCFETGDGWKKLCGFLEKPIPDKSFPHVNKGKYKK